MEPFDDDVTAEEEIPPDPPEPIPGAIIMVEDGRPACRTLVFNGYRMEIGRATGSREGLRDPFVSDRHCWITVLDGEIVVSQPDDSPGTWIDGCEISGRSVVDWVTTLRVGRSLLMLCDDVTRYVQRPVALRAGRVEGLLDVAHHAWLLDPEGMLVVYGEPGTGKREAARMLHAAAKRSNGPFVTVPSGLLDPWNRNDILFGLRKGFFEHALDGYPGAVDRAEGGSLLLEHIHLFHRDVQGSFAHVLDGHRSTSLFSWGEDGKHDVAFIGTTTIPTDRLYKAGRFSASFGGRMKSGHVNLRPLRNRREEIPWFVDLAFQRANTALGYDIGFVEACCLRDWRAENVRELMNTVTEAIRSATMRGGSVVTAEDLPAVRTE